VQEITDVVPDIGKGLLEQAKEALTGGVRLPGVLLRILG
jgi:hypothetical protein